MLALTSLVLFVYRNIEYVHSYLFIFSHNISKVNVYYTALLFCFYSEGFTHLCSCTIWFFLMIKRLSGKIFQLLNEQKIFHMLIKTYKSLVKWIKLSLLKQAVKKISFFSQFFSINLNNETFCRVTLAKLSCCWHEATLNSM